MGSGSGCGVVCACHLGAWVSMKEYKPSEHVYIIINVYSKTIIQGW